ncbi:MAG: CSLREA domain-containing protein, partial [Anaerolineae bacterium]
MRKNVLTMVGLVLMLLLLAALGSAQAEGATYTVNTTSDTIDGLCDALSPTTDCTLRDAIQVAGANSGIDTIAFDIPITDTNYGHNTTGVWTIVLSNTLGGPLGDIVDGTTQATNYGSDTNPYGPEIEISGENLIPYATMWSIRYSNNTIKGLAINRGTGYGIFITDGDDNTIIGNYIGTDATGTTDQGMVWQGILIGNGAQRNTIGGPSQAERNIISGNDGGIRIFGGTGTTTGNVIEGNYIGTDRTGIAALGNGYGIQIHADAYDNTIGPNNVIAYNTGNGVVVNGANTNGNTITQNSIHSNGGLGINLINGGNDSILAPVISWNIRTSASGTAPVAATVELFTGPDDEGKTYLTTVSADGSGNWSGSGFLADDTYLTATATDAAGNTSEFS